MLLDPVVHLPPLCARGPTRSSTQPSRRGRFWGSADPLTLGNLPRITPAGRPLALGRPVASTARRDSRRRPIEKAAGNCGRRRRAGAFTCSNAIGSSTFLDEACSAAAWGGGSVVVVDGPSGIGITALLEIAAQRFAVSADVVQVRGSDVEAGLPFASAVHVAEQVASINRRHGRPDVQAAAEDLVDALLTVGSAVPVEPLVLIRRTTSYAAPLRAIRWS